MNPPLVTRVHLELDNWDGDDLTQAFPVYAVTEKLGQELQNRHYRAFELRDMEVTLAPEGSELLEQLGVDLPTFRWLHVTGTPGVDDLGITGRTRLVVSEAALATFQQFRLTATDVEEYDPARHA